MAQRINFLPHQEGEGTPSALESRRRIMLNTPHLVTNAPTYVHNVKTDMRAPLKECRIYFMPYQTGSGTPSPDNIRPIIGRTGLTIYQGHVGSDDTETIEASTLVDWSDTIGTVYGGYVDLVKEVIVKTWQYMRVDATTRATNHMPMRIPGGGTAYSFIDSATGVEYGRAAFWRTAEQGKAIAYSKQATQFCDVLPYKNLSGVAAPNTFGIYDGDRYGLYVTLPISDIGTTAESLADYMSTRVFNVAYQLRQEEIYPLDPITLKTLRGAHQLWSDANGTIDLTYWTHKE